MAESVQKFFTGSFTHTIDRQNRVTIPAIWRGSKSAGEQEFFIVPHPDKALWVLPAAEMARLHEKLAEKSMADRDTWNFVRVFSGRMQQCILDVQGKLTIGDWLLKYAELVSGKEVVLVGLVKHFEIWKPDLWAQLDHSAEANYGDIAARVGL